MTENLENSHITIMALEHAHEFENILFPQASLTLTIIKVYIGDHKERACKRFS